MTQTPRTPDTAELDRLARAARSLPVGVLPDGLWEPVMRLATWWIPADHTPEAVAPLLGAIEGATAMFAFTTRERAEAFITTMGLDDEQKLVLPTAVPPAYVVDRSQIYSQMGANVLVFDCNDVGYFAPVDKLHDLWRRYHGDWVHRTEGDVPELRSQHPGATPDPSGA